MDCVVCDKIKEKKALIVYEDDNLVAVLPSKPAVPGHIKIMPKQHATKLDELSDEIVEELFFLSNFSSASVFEVLKAHGTNIILNEGDNHLSIDVIPRKEGDGLNFMWKPKQVSPEEMDEIYSKIKDKAFVIGKKEFKPELVNLDEKKAESILSDVSQKKDSSGSESKDAGAGKNDGKENKQDDIIRIPKQDKTNYLIKQLQKIP